MDDLSPLEMAMIEAKEWGKETIGIMRSKTHTDTGTLDRSLRAIVKKDRFGELRAVTFKMVRYAVFHELGAGRDYRGAKGSSWKYVKPDKVSRPITKYKGAKVGDKRTTSQTARNNMGSGKRPAVPFFDETLRDQIPKLADRLAAVGADLVIKGIGIQERF